MKLKKNVGRLDRDLRVLAGAGLVAAGLFLQGGIRGRSGGVLLALAGVFVLIVGFVRFCPFYVPFRISTTRKPGV